jgi:hypothetical protein
MLRAASFQNVDEAAGGGMQIGFVADGMQPAAKKKGLRHVPLGQARTLGYINQAPGRKGDDRLWPILLQKSIEASAEQ